MSNTDFNYTGTEIESAISGLRAYGIAAGYPRDTVLDLCSEFKTQIAAQRHAREAPPRSKKKLNPRNPLYKGIYEILRKNGWDDVFFIIESRKGWRRVKFMEFYKTHPDKFKFKVLNQIIDSVGLEYDFAAQWYGGFCHAPYDALVIKIPTK